MQIAKSLKVWFIIINHIIAINLTVDVVPPPLRGRARYNAGLEPLFPRLPKSQNIWSRLQPCDAACSSCKGPNEVKNKEECWKCDKCPPNKKPNKARTKCEDKRSKEDRFKQIFKERFKEYKSKAFPKWQKIKKKDYERKEENRRRVKARRGGSCLQMVPYAMGLTAMGEYTNMFDQDFVEGKYLEQFWPDDLEVPELTNKVSSDIFLKSDKFSKQWVTFGQELAKQPEPDDLPAGLNGGDINLYLGDLVPRAPVSKDLVVRSSGAGSTRTDLILRDPSLHEKRFIPALLAIFSAIVRIATIAARVSRVWLRAAEKVTEKAVKVSKGRNKVSVEDKMSGARKIADSKYWRRCLEGKGPK